MRQIYAKEASRTEKLDKQFLDIKSGSGYVRYVQDSKLRGVKF